MRVAPFLAAVLAVPLLLLTPRPALAGTECKVEIGPRDRVAKGETLVVRSGERIESAVVIDGDLVVEEGAVVEKAVALGGKVTVRSGARVTKDAVSIGGDVVVEADGRVGKDAVSLGGQVRQAPGAKVGGSVLGLAFQAGKSSLAAEILKGLGPLESCVVKQKGATES